MASMVARQYRFAMWQNAVVVLLCCWVLCPADSHAQIRLSNVTKETGISFRHTDGSSGKHYIVEYVSAGLALFDYDGDGDIDIYFLNGAPLRGTIVEVTPKNTLYRNDNGWRFTDVTDEAGVGDTGHGLGVAVGDYDNDGDPDLYLNNYGPNVLYRNNGNGTFTDVTQTAGVGNGHRVGAGANFLDVDKDGDLDLFVSNYIKFSYGKHVPRTRMGFPVYPSPRDYEPDPDTLYRNNGDGTFTDVTVTAGIAMYAGPGMGTICADYDDDGDTDIFVGNDVEANFLFQNDGTGKFKEFATMAGVAYDFGGMEQGSMGAECGDYNNDGLLDFHVTAYQQELATLYKNMGNGLFEDITIETGAGIGTRRHVTWGAGLVDFDNDGNRDLFIACGDLDDHVESFEDILTYNSPNSLLLNTGDGKFVNISDKSGDGLAVKLSSRGAGFDDLDNDGDIDVIILNSRREPTTLRNDSANNNHWIQIHLRGVKTNRDGVGARVKVMAGDLTLIDEVHSGRGYQSHYGMRLHFGLGNRKKVDRIEVCWIGGEVDIFEDIEVDKLLTITEGTGLAR
ncbi:MAG: CRTAC1 family protein [Planctomycetota bacterium]|jgi:hypothetical protein